MKKIVLVLLLASLVYGGVSSTINRMPLYNCNGSTKIFPFTFPIVATTDIKVILITKSTGDSATLVKDTNYTVSAVNNDYSSGGNITTKIAYSSLYQLLLIRDIPITQETDLISDSGVLRTKALVDSLDKLVMISQDNKEKIGRCLKTEQSEPNLISGFPLQRERASKYLAFDSDGNPIASSGPSGDSNIPMSAFAETLIDDSNATIARNTLEITSENLGLHINVMDYGATGDGITDDTSAIQDALTAAGTSGRVYFPDGTYKVSEAEGLPLVYHPNLLIEGESREGVIIENTDTNDFAFEWKSSVGDAYTTFPNPGGFMHMQINSKYGIKFNQTLAEIGGIYSGAWDQQDLPLGWKIYDVTFKGAYTSDNDPNANTDTEPASVDDYTTYGIGLQIVRPFLTNISQCAFRGQGVGLYMEGCDLTFITNNRFIGNSCHIYATNATDSNYGFNSVVSHNDILTCYRRRHVWLDGQDAKLGGWSICNNFFESSGDQAEYIYESGCFGHKIYANFFNATGQTTSGTPMMSFVNSSKDHVIYGNGYGASVNTPAIHVEWMSGTLSSKKWIHFFGNVQDFPLPDNPRAVMGTQETSNPFKFDCISNQQKWEAGNGHAVAAPFVKFDDFFHVDTSTGVVDLFFRDGQVDRLTSFTVHVKGVVTGGANGNDNIPMLVYHDAVQDYTGNILTNVTDGELVDIRIPITSGAGVKRIYFNGGSAVNYLAISSVEIEPAIERIKIPTFPSADATPSVANTSIAYTNATGVTITELDDGVAGQEVTLISGGATVFDTTSNARLLGSSADITTAAGDITKWVCTVGGTTASVWTLVVFVDASQDNSSATTGIYGK